MPFGLCNAPATFQRLMDRVYNGIAWKFVVVYLDDTIVYSRTFDEHLEHLQKVFTRIRKAGLQGKCGRRPCSRQDERRNSRALVSKVSSVTNIGWNCASPTPTAGPKGTKPRCWYNLNCLVVPEIMARSYPFSTPCCHNKARMPCRTCAPRNFFSTASRRISHIFRPAGRYESRFSSF